VTGEVASEVPLTLRCYIILKQLSCFLLKTKTKKKLHGLSPRANYTDRATAACRRSDCQLLRIESATWSAWRIPPAVFSRFSRQEPLLFHLFYLCYKNASTLNGWLLDARVPSLIHKSENIYLQQTVLIILLQQGVS
jgi:hypothetical protein